LRLPNGRRSGLSAGSGEEGYDDVGGVSVERDTRSVVTQRGPGIDVAGGFLDVAHRDAGVGARERAGDGSAYRALCALQQHVGV